MVHLPYSASAVLHEFLASCGEPHDESMDDDDLDAIEYLDEIEELHEELEEEEFPGVDDPDDERFEDYIRRRKKRYRELERLEAIALDTEFMKAAAAWGLEEHLVLLAKQATRLPDLKPSQVDDAEEDPSLRRYLDERAKIAKKEGQEEVAHHLDDVDNNAIDLKHTEKLIKKNGDKTRSARIGAKLKKVASMVVSADLKAEYQAFFKKMLAKHGVKSPAELPDDKKDDFFNEVERYWAEGKGLTEEGKKAMAA